MKTVLVPALEVSRNREVRRVRELPVEGELLVNVGDRVRASQIVARAELPGDLFILKIPEKMGIEAPEVLEGLQVKEGSLVETGQAICSHSGLFGLFKSVFKSPGEGIIEFISEKTGHIGLRQPPELLELDAYLSGVVAEIEDSKSITILAEGAYIQGIFGIGGERNGTLKILECGFDQILKESDIPKKCTGLILAGGYAPDCSTLKAASDRGAQALITGSLDDEALTGYLGYDLGIAVTGDEDVSMTVIMTEGFGGLPISERAVEILKSFADKEVSVNGATQVRAGAVRPEIIIPDVECSGEKDSFDRYLETGAGVRLIRVPYFGKRAVIEELPVEPEKIETGAVTRVLRARLESGELVTVPRANVELI